MQKNKQHALELFSPATKTKQMAPLFEHYVEAGFPSPADDYIEKTLDLNELCIQHPSATFYVRIKGESMVDAHIYPGDIVIIDRAIESASGKIILAVLNGEFTIKRLIKENNTWILKAENNAYQPIQIKPNDTFEVWGVITYVIHKTN